MKEQPEKTQEHTSNQVVHLVHANKHHVSSRIRGCQLPLMVHNGILELLHCGILLCVQLALHLSPGLDQCIHLFSMSNFQAGYLSGQLFHLAVQTGFHSPQPISLWHGVVALSSPFVESTFELGQPLLQCGYLE